MPEIENLMLANHAEAREGLLYLSGAGWTDLRQMAIPGAPPPPFHIGVGLTVLVSWNETNRRHHVTISLEPEDGGAELLRVDADLEVGRPAGVVEGTDQRAVLAVAGEVQFPTPGGYRLAAQIAGGTRYVSFRVHHDGAPVFLQRPA